jgi:hypothetical protein
MTGLVGSQFAQLTPLTEFQVPVFEVPILYAPGIPIIGVGATDDQGNTVDYSNTGSQVLFYASGDIVCPTATGTSGKQFRQGSSFCRILRAQLILKETLIFT